MYTWFSDLDNTLIYSHRASFESEKVLVEYLNGKEQSYMTMRTYMFMRNMNIPFVPVTTRSLEQYRRLFIFEKEIKVRHALVCNGAILLNNMNVDSEWLKETHIVAREGIRYLKKLQMELDEYDINDVEGLMLYFKADNPDIIARNIREKYNSRKVYIGFDKRKVYIVPSEINKGSAIYRYCNRFGVVGTISSGDSEFDLSMLNATDISIAAESMLRRLDPKGVRYQVGTDLIISDDICNYIKKIVEENVSCN